MFSRAKNVLIGICFVASALLAGIATNGLMPAPLHAQWECNYEYCGGLSCRATGMERNCIDDWFSCTTELCMLP